MFTPKSENREMPLRIALQHRRFRFFRCDFFFLLSCLFFLLFLCVSPRTIRINIQGPRIHMYSIDRKYAIIIVFAFLSIFLSNLKRR